MSLSFCKQSTFEYIRVVSCTWTLSTLFCFLDKDIEIGALESGLWKLSGQPFWYLRMMSRLTWTEESTFTEYGLTRPVTVFTWPRGWFSGANGSMQLRRLFLIFSLSSDQIESVNFLLPCSSTHLTVTRPLSWSLHPSILGCDQMCRPRAQRRCSRCSRWSKGDSCYATKSITIARERWLYNLIRWHAIPYPRLMPHYTIAKHELCHYIIWQFGHRMQVKQALPKIYCIVLAICQWTITATYLNHKKFFSWPQKPTFWHPNDVSTSNIADIWTTVERTIVYSSPPLIS